jgi:chaperonin GroEL
MRRNPGMPSTGKENHVPPPRKPAVVLQPRTYDQVKKGINLVADAIRPTLGPRPRLVMMEALRRTDKPEILDDAATIARRIVAIEPRGFDVGAMLIRHALWQMHRQAGDGSATMAVMYQVILNEGIRYITQAGANAMLLRSGLEQGLRAVTECLDQMAAPLAGKEQFTNIVRSTCPDDAEMAGMLGEIFDIVGAEGLIVIEKWNKAGLEREYIDGTYWKLSGWFSRWLVTDPIAQRTMFEDASLLISDLTLTNPDQLVPVLDKCVQAGVKRLVIIAKEVSDSVIGLLVKNNRAKTIQTLAIRTPKISEMDRVAAMEDIAMLVGGKIFYSAGKDTFENFQAEDLGQARRAWATDSLFGIFGGKGDPRQLRQHRANIRGMLQVTQDENEKNKLQERLGRVSGGTAILRVGGLTDTEIEVRKGMAERAVIALRNAVLGGVAPGGGVALLNAQSALAGLSAKHEEDTAAYKILARALEEPMRTIAQNAGSIPDVIIEKVKSCPKGYGFEARSRQIIDLRQTGILDSVLVLKKALEIAVSGAAMTLTTDVIVHHKEPKESLEP